VSSKLEVQTYFKKQQRNLKFLWQDWAQWTVGESCENYRPRWGLSSTGSLPAPPPGCLGTQGCCCLQWLASFPDQWLTSFPKATEPWLWWLGLLRLQASHRRKQAIFGNQPVYLANKMRCPWLNSEKWPCLGHLKPDFAPGQPWSQGSCSPGKLFSASCLRLCGCHMDLFVLHLGILSRLETCLDLSIVSLFFYQSLFVEPELLPQLLIQITYWALGLDSCK
jgi:hypothetical protein